MTASLYEGVVNNNGWDVDTRLREILVKNTPRCAPLMHRRASSLFLRPRPSIAFRPFFSFISGDAVSSRPFIDLQEQRRTMFQTDGQKRRKKRRRCWAGAFEVGNATRLPLCANPRSLRDFLRHRARFADRSLTATRVRCLLVGYR